VVKCKRKPNWLRAQFDALAREEIFGQQPHRAAPASISPNDPATPVDGGKPLLDTLADTPTQRITSCGYAGMAGKRKRQRRDSDTDNP